MDDKDAKNTTDAQANAFSKMCTAERFFGGSYGVLALISIHYVFVETGDSSGADSSCNFKPFHCIQKDIARR
jgi:hypothetical protein